MRNDLIIEKMIQLIEKIERYTKGLSYDDFCNDEMVVDACVFNLSQLGETSNKISESFEVDHPEIPWRQLYGLRNRIVHDYDGVKLTVVWEVICGDLPELKGKLENM